MKKGTAKQSKAAKSKTVVEEPVKEQSFHFDDPLYLIGVLSENDIGRTLQALKGLKIFARQNHLQTLLDNELHEKLILLFKEKKSSSEIIEFSLELLAELLNFENVFKRIAEEQELILFLYTFLKSSPLDIQVQCLKCLSILSSVVSICELLAENCDLNLLYNKINQNDPDVQASTLKIIMNLVKTNLVIAEKVVNLSGFSYSSLFNLLNSAYPIIQHRALNLIIYYTSFDHVTILRQMFVDQKGINALITMIEAHKWPDMHEKVFTILNNIGCLDDTYTKLGETGIQMLIGYVDNIESQRLQFTSYDTLLKLTNKSPYGLKLFVNNGLFDLVINHLKDDQGSFMFRRSVRGMAFLSSDNDTVTRMEEDPSLILILFDVLNNENKKFDWSIRSDAATAIYSMMSKSKVFYDTLLEHNKWEIVVYLLDNVKTDAPYKTQLILANILKEMHLDVFKSLSCPDEMCKNVVLILNQLMLLPQTSAAELKCIATNMVENLVEFPSFREVLKEAQFYQSLAKLLFRTNESLTVMEAYIKMLITLVEWDSSFIDELTYVQAIDWFIEQRDIHRNLPIARRFLDLVFEKCKYIKIHFTNRLEPWDKIESGFYLSRTFSHEKSYFKSLISYVREKYVKARPIYFVDFDDTGMLERLKKCSTQLSLESTYGIEIKADSSSTLFNENPLLGIETLRDPFLKLKLEELKELLGYKPDQFIALNLGECLKREEYLQKIKILSDFVCNLMSGADKDEEECRDHSFALHLTEIKNDLASSVIPLGYLKLGNKFERALLFKTLGDQVGIPSAFIRAYCGNGWNEVYLTPEKEIEEESDSLLLGSNKEISDKQRTLSYKSDTSTRGDKLPQNTGKKSITKIEKKFSRQTSSNMSFVNEEEESMLPTDWHLHAYKAYMKTNHVVDLDRNPGEIYQIGSVKAEEYTSALGPVHPYFNPRITIPPLIKTSSMNLEQKVV